MKCLFFSVLILFVSVNVEAQGTRSLGLTLKSGIGEFKRISGEDDFFGLNTVTTSPAFAWGVMVDAEKQFSKYFSGQSQVGYHNIRGNEMESYAVIDLETGQSTAYRSETERNANYLSLTTILNLHPNSKLIVGMGFSMNFLLSNSYLTHGYINEMPGYIMGGGNDLLKFDLGLNPQVGYCLTDKIKIYAAAQFGLLNVRDPEFKDSFSREMGIDSGTEINLKSRLYTIGLKYTLFKDKDQ